jgi:hypothetical protein
MDGSDQNGPIDWQICWLWWSYSNLGLKEENFRDFKDFDDFEAVFHQIFTESRYLGFTKSGALTVYRYSTLLLADQTVHFDNTQNPHPVPFAPGLCLTVVDIKFAVKQISQF